MTFRPPFSFRAGWLRPSADAPSHLSLPAWGWRVSLLILLALAGFVRLLDISDPPLDFHSTRQLRNAIVARGLYYKALPNADPALREQALAQRNSVGQYEPPILESLAAWTYARIGAESFAVPRVWNTLFWLLAALALFGLTTRAAGVEAALLTVGFFTLLPFAVQASRSFQPDPLMTAAMVAGLYFLYRWAETPRWVWAIAAGLTLGFAALVKIVIAFLIAGAAIGLVLFTLGWRKFWREKQVWAMAALMALPAFLYYVVFSPERSSEYFFSWTLALLQLIISPAFYVRWLSFLHTLFGLTPLFLSLSGTLLAAPRLRAMLIGLWVGYLLYGLTLPYQMYTHSYYHLQLTPLIALGLAPWGEIGVQRLNQQAVIWRWLLLPLAIGMVAYPAWVARSTLLAEDFRAEPAYWAEVGNALPFDGKIIALTQDYGFRLMYFGWRKVDLWPITGEQELAALRGDEKNFEEQFAKRTKGKDYFVITAFGQYNKQPALQQMLTENYRLIAESDGYLVFDLRETIK